MKIGVFIYDFPHWKSQNGLFNLCFNNYKPSLALSASAVKINFYQSKIRTSTKDLLLYKTKDLCEYYDIPYYNVVHNSVETVEIIKKNKLDLGIILGARILSKEVISAFKIGIINMHPGILPENRGLDNVKWSVIKNLPIGVTCHFVDARIDMGKKILSQTIEIYPDDEFLDFCVRNQNLEQKLMIEALEKVTREYPNIKTSTLGRGFYHKALNPEIEQHLYEHVLIYKERHFRPPMRGFSDKEMYYFS
jgi:folate-dependent phosphoribosylglycinamide formyltransferase PurN